MRLVCDSTYLFDKKSNVSPKLDEFGEVVADLMSSGNHKAVVFSQWETMLHKTAEVLDRLGVGYALLHGGMQGKERRAVMEQFKQEACRVFLSTDAGGVGLNLQQADTVVNLELPWNPAVLEQRIARVHRMGQSRPVRVINFVTRGTIEERVLKSIEAKQSLFGSVFDGDSDSVDFAALGSRQFLTGISDVIGVERPAPEPEPAARAISATGLLEANVRMLEALAAWDESVNWPPELKQRAAAALNTILRRIEGD
jgi:SNF2 family DNA or RNA helicase